MNVWTQAAIAARVHKGVPQEKKRRLVQEAAVAVLLDFVSEPTKVLLMRRSKRRGDPWSGQVSLPGGRREPADVSIVHTARRECLEEVGFDLEKNATLIGHLDAVEPIIKGFSRPLRVAPIVFEQVGQQALNLGQEASKAFWLPLDSAASGALDDTFVYTKGPIHAAFPCWRFDDEIVWGLTYKILDGLLNNVSISS
jgi:8-oxo-dGTP pyrophosphatase MutT (NUDIX family)